MTSPRFLDAGALLVQAVKLLNIKALALLSSGLVKHVEGCAILPQGREADHASENDHYTVFLKEKDGNYIKIEHFDKKYTMCTGAASYCSGHCFVDFPEIYERMRF